MGSAVKMVGHEQWTVPLVFVLMVSLERTVNLTWMNANPHHVWMDPVQTLLGLFNAEEKTPQPL